MNKKQLSDKELEQLIGDFAQRASSPQAAFSADKSYEKFRQRLPNKQRSHISLYIRYAVSVAAVFLAVLCGYGIYTHLAQPQMMVMTTTDNIAEVSLPDGSSVTLGRYSSLAYAKTMKGDERTVTLTGEAYFDVAKDAARPFIVQVEELDVKVLGTQFNVQAYPKSEEVRTTLLEGAVAVYLKEGEGSVRLSPLESAVYHKTSAVLQKEIAPYAADEIGWMKGTFIFREAPLRDIIQRLNNYYGTDLRIADKAPGEYKISATFDEHERLDDILKLLQQVGHFHFDNGVIYAGKD